ncbi:MAG TPA: DPP IV N-terminal domain-containing protein [Pirellulales bacterium]|jgi:dipeptidyl aminopeptidase/acylaminoacyl peptidase|nr:DPP IV N-terminal domain-containing protein [Pirellulales bacterium]
MLASRLAVGISIAARVLVLLFVAKSSLFAQGTQADYDRANHLAESVRGKVFRAAINPRWFDGDKRFWYRNDLAEGRREFVVVDAAAGTRSPAFDHARLADALCKLAGKELTADKLPIDQLEFAGPDGPLVLDALGKGWQCDLSDYTIKEHAPPKPAPETASRGNRRGRRQGPPPAAKSPDGQWQAFIKSDNVYLRQLKEGSELQLSDDGAADDSYMDEFYWSPDSKKLVALRTKRGEDHKVYLVQSSPTSQLQPKLLSYDYLKPGDRIPLPKPHLFDVAAKKQIAVSDDLFPNPWSVEQIRWNQDSKRFTFLYNQRGHQSLRIIAVDADGGSARSIVDEQSKTFIDYSGKQFVDYVDGSGEIIWMSERDGWNHLYLYDAKTGQVKSQITRGPWVVREVELVDDEKRQIWFRAGGIRGEQDPYYIHFCRVNFDGSDLTVLTECNGTHAVAFSPDRRYLIDTWSRVDLPPVSELRDARSGKLICELERADATALLATGWKPPEPFVAKGRDGKTDIYGVIFRPTNLDPEKKYPVLEDIYAGPQSSFVPKSFSEFRRQQAMAELGFIVVQIDGMGTSNRSKAFHEVCWKNLADAGLPDRIAWIKAAAAKYPYLDISRVGVYGTSAGGQSALGALLFHGDFYKAAVADCGCHDNRMDKIWWNELWMGWPVGPEYAANSNVTNAAKLQGKLLLIVGETDHNVDPASTMQVVNALIKADKDFDLLVIPGADHGQDGPYGIRRRQDFFVRNLLGVEPRSGK